MDDLLSHERLEIDVHFARLDFREIEQVIDQRQPMTPARLHGLELLFLVRVERTRQRA